MNTDESRQLLVEGIAEELSRNTGFLVRQRWLAFGILSAYASFVSVVTCFAAETCDLTADLKSGQVQQVQAVLEVRGDLLVKAEEGGQQKLPIVVTGKVCYDERLLTVSASKNVRRAVRHYSEAKAEVKVGQGLAKPALNPERRIIVSQTDDDGAVLFSPLGPLSRDDLELVDIPGNSLAVPGVLPSRSIQVGDRWMLDREPLAVLLGLDVITQSDVQGTLEKLDGSTAILVIDGAAEGAVEGVVSKIEIRAKANFDVTRRAVTWLAANIRERREIGQAEPGFDVVARIRLALSPQSQSDALDDQKLGELALTPDAGSTLLEFHPLKSGFRLIHDRRWRVMVDRHDVCVLRCVDRGDLIAQCNISELADAEPGKRMALETFQQQVRQSLTGSAGEISEASQNTTDEGQRVLRVQAAGVTSEVPIVWVFYHISNEQGRQTAFSFTLESKMLERFAEGDRTLVESFLFTPRAQPQEAQNRQSSVTTR